MAEHVGREQQISALGQVWKVGRWTREVWSDYITWAKLKLPDPIETVYASIVQMEKAGNAPPHALQEFLVRQAVDKKASYLSVSSPEMQSLLSSAEGSSYLLFLLLRKNQPGITEDQAYEVMLEVPAEVLSGLFLKASGKGSAGGNAEARSA